MSFCSRVYLHLKPVLLLYIIILLFLGTYSYIGYISYFDDFKEDLKNESQYISHTLQEIFDFSSQLATYLGSQIAVTENKNVNKVVNIIVRAKEQFEHNKPTNSLSWINIGWINTNNILIFEENIIQKFFLCSNTKNT